MYHINTDWFFYGGVFFQVSYSVHEVVRKDKYSKEDITTPIEPILTSRFVL